MSDASDETRLPPGGRPSIPDRSAQRRWFVPARIGAPVLILLCAIAWLFRYTTLFEDGTVPASAGPTTASPVATAPPAPTATTAVPSPTSPSASATPEPSTGPRFDYFRVAQPPVCASTGPGGSSGGTVKLEWSISGGATGSALYVDGAGRYGTYGPKASPTLAFACPGNPGGTASHSYTVTTVGGGPQRTRTITVSATIPA